MAIAQNVNREVKIIKNEIATCPMCRALKKPCNGHAVRLEFAEAGRLVTISKEAAKEFEENLAKNFAEIQADYKRKEAASWRAVKDIILD